MPEDCFINDPAYYWDFWHVHNPDERTGGIKPSFFKRHLQPCQYCAGAACLECNWEGVV